MLKVYFSSQSCQSVSAFNLAVDQWTLHSFFSSSYMVNSADFALTNKVYLFHTVILFGGHSHLKKSQQTNKSINDK